MFVCFFNNCLVLTLVTVKNSWCCNTVYSTNAVETFAHIGVNFCSLLQSLEQTTADLISLFLNKSGKIAIYLLCCEIYMILHLSPKIPNKSITLHCCSFSLWRRLYQAGWWPGILRGPCGDLSRWSLGDDLRRWLGHKWRSCSVSTAAFPWCSRGSWISCIWRR